jgi:hypothetical protein
VIDGDDCGAVSEMKVWQEELKYLEKTCPSASLATTDHTHDLFWSETQATLVGNQQLGARVAVHSPDLVTNAGYRLPEQSLKLLRAGGTL